MKNLALKYKIKIVWFYGEPGHGSRLVDAMSSFGCKGPLWRMIIDNDQWYGSAEDIMALETYFSDNESKIYRLVDPSDLILERIKRKEHKIKGCKKLHMICVDKDE